MRSLLLINPNTTVAMTEQMAAAAARLMPEGVALEALTAQSGAPVIASRASYALAAEAVLEVYARARGAYGAVVIGCFGDPGLEALRALAREPVLGLAESSIREADALGEPFAILTIGKAWVEMLSERVAVAAVKTPFVGVFAGEGTGLDVSRREEAVVAELNRHADAAVAAGARTLILGGAALTGMAERLSAEARLIDCVDATVRAALAAM
jgi:Asp/Glu/hydantoin racemase